VRQSEQVFVQAELMKDFQRLCMDGVAAEVSEEVRMLLQDNDIDARSCENVPEQHARRPAADDAALRLDLFSSHLPVALCRVCAG